LKYDMEHCGYSNSHRINLRCEANHPPWSTAGAPVNAALRKQSAESRGGKKQTSNYYKKRESCLLTPFLREDIFPAELPYVEVGESHCLVSTSPSAHASKITSKCKPFPHCLVQHRLFCFFLEAISVASSVESDVLVYLQMVTCSKRLE
jgi:hypothetical protein